MTTPTLQNYIDSIDETFPTSGRDNNSNDFLKSVTLDYVSNLIGNSLTFNNVEQISSCGCGKSFSI